MHRMAETADAVSCVKKHGFVDKHKLVPSEQKTPNRNSV